MGGEDQRSRSLGGRGEDTESGVHVRRGMAGAPAGARTAFCAAGGRGRPGPEELGGTGVRRRAAGRRTPERTAGDLRPDPGGRAGVHGRREGGKAYYRLQAGQRGGGEHPATAPALQRMQGEKTVLCVQDGSTLNFAKRGNGLGIRNQTAAAARGLHLHATVNTDGLPLGVLRAAFDAPQPGAEKNKPREEKKSYRRGSSRQRRGRRGWRASGRRPGRRSSSTCSSSGASGRREWNSWCGRRPTAFSKRTTSCSTRCGRARRRAR